MLYGHRPFVVRIGLHVSNKGLKQIAVGLHVLLGKSHDLSRALCPAGAGWRA